MRVMQQAGQAQGFGSGDFALIQIRFTNFFESGSGVSFKIQK